MNKNSLALLPRLGAVFCVAFCTAASTLSWADPPSRVGRISHVEGETSFFADREEGWTAARMNFPVTSENSLWTTARGRAEVRIGAAALRIDANTILDFVSVGDDNIDTFLQRGTLNIRTRNVGDADGRDVIRVDTGEGSFFIDSNGRYRIDAAGDGGQSRIAVFAGRARFEGDGNALNVDAGKALLIRTAPGTSRGASDFRFERASESSFDRWAEARDIRWDETHTRYVREQSISPYMTGYEDLDAYGDWVEDRQYGRVWTPRVVAAGWAPYRYGSWAYVNPWGWTWVDDAPWGFAPFHYGRWVQVGVRWAWWPGTYTRRPVYAPALVGWMGERPGVRVSVSVGPSVGWFPLAPREHYIPPYTNNVTYIRRVNVITNNVTIINPPNHFANRAPGATFVSGKTFVNSRPIQANTIRTNPLQVSSHPVVTSPEPPGGAWRNLRARALQQSQASAPTPAPQAASPSYSPQFNRAPNTLVQPSRPQNGEMQRGPSRAEQRTAPPTRDVVAQPAPIQAPLPPPATQPMTAPNNRVRSNPIPPRELPAVANERQWMQPQRSVEPDGKRPSRQQGGREERSVNRAPEAIRPAEISRPPTPVSPVAPVENRPRRVEPPAVTAPAPPAAAPAVQAPRPLQRIKQEGRDNDGR